MAFVNPLDILNIPHVTPETFRLERKRLFSMADLSSDGMLDVGNGKYLSKSDIIKLCEDLEKDGALVYYAAIKSHRLLSDFLTSGKLLFFRAYDTLPFGSLAGFYSFIYPYFAHQFRRSISSVYAKGSTKNTRSNADFVSLCNFQLPFSPEDNMACFLSLKQGMFQDAVDIKQALKDLIRNQDTVAFWDKMMSVIKPVMWNNLPVGLEAEKRDIAEALFGNSNQLHIQTNWLLNLELLDWILKVKWEEGQRKRFAKLRADVKRKGTDGIKSFRNSKTSYGWRVVMFFALVLFFNVVLPRLFTKNEPSVTYSLLPMDGNMGARDSAEVQDPLLELKAYFAKQDSITNARNKNKPTEQRTEPTKLDQLNLKLKENKKDTLTYEDVVRLLKLIEAEQARNKD